MEACPKCGSKNLGRTADSFDLTWYCNDCRWNSDERPSKPSKPVKATPDLIRRVDDRKARDDIESALNVWRGEAFNRKPFDAKYREGVIEAEQRVNVFLARREADRKQLADALAALAKIREVVNTDAEDEDAISSQYRQIDDLAASVLDNPAH